MKTLSLALDWTPNINHIGFFIAKEKGFYISKNIKLEILNPEVDNYQTTPAKKVSLELADFALCPMESIISYQTKKTPFPIIAIATVYEEDTSAIVVHADSLIESPKDLDGKTYASYKARYEDQIVQQMIKNDGGSGEIDLVYPEKLGIWDTILNRTHDATWIFTNWEGIQAEVLNLPLCYFKMKDYKVPYSYSPVIAANKSLTISQANHYKDFLNATRDGFIYAQSNPKEAKEILSKYVPKKDSDIDLNKSIEASAHLFGTKESWGKMEPENVASFLEWIYKNNLETQPLKPQDLFTNDLL